MRLAVFVFIKNGDYKCLDLADTLKSETLLKKNGWKHSATIRPDLWIEQYLNGNEYSRFQQIEDVSA